MKYRKSGTSALEVSAPGTGCMNLSASTGSAAEKGCAVGVIRTAVERGITFVDTAEAYGPCVSEELL